LLLPALALALGERFLGHAAPAGLLGVTFVAGVIALAPFALAASGFGLLVDQTRGIATLARLDLEPRARKERLDEASTVGRAIGSTHASLALAATLLLGLLALLGAGPLKLQSSLGLAGLSTAGGVSLVLLFGARSAGSAVAGARLVASEVERQLREFPRQQGIALVPADFTPSYRACVDAAFAAARGASLPEAALLLFTPFLLGLLLKAGSEPPFLQPLIGFGVAAVLSGVVYALAARGTQAVLDELRRRTRSNDPGAGSVAFSTYGELVGVTAAASVEALVCALALTVLCLAALLT
jgi:Na+/H+-translocating membrane pyrophosphatase